ncbi:MAG: phosphoglucomutase/phosphomannomutase family protein [Cyanobacteria bacterium]|nr:phosphoglucomutase/phosphomannomutase family protein [Cyanobacteriota bacterium]
MGDAPLNTGPKPIKFGTDGWRGVIAADFTFERVERVAPLAARVLAAEFGPTTGSRTVVVGFDRRFMAEHFAIAAARAIAAAGYDVWLSKSFAPTPTFSWIAHHEKLLGAIVLTASHNPGPYLGLKVKGAFGGSVSPEVTHQIEDLLAQGEPVAIDPPPTPGTITEIDPWASGFCEDLRSKVDIEAIRGAIAAGQLQVFADVMHGAAAGGLEKILGLSVGELNGDRDPLFAGAAPEPLAQYTQASQAIVREAKAAKPEALTVGLVFDGDCDRIAAIDSDGAFFSSQVLIPILIEHLCQRRGYGGEVVKTVSGSDLMPKTAALYGLAVYETAVGYKYIADRMLSVPVMLGGEESGGIGYGHHIPERDALLAALYLLEAVVMAQRELGDLYRALQEKTGFSSAYDRIDLPLATMEARDRVIAALQTEPPTAIAGQAVTDCQTTDGYKFRLADGRWLMIRFSGTEPVLRLYCEGPDDSRVAETLAWAKTWAEAIA